MNPVLMIAFNNMELTKRAVESVLTQTIPVHLTFIDNGSTDGTSEWVDSLAQERIRLVTIGPNRSVAQVANRWMENIFNEGHPYLLGVPNDVILSPTLYENFLSFPRGIVTGSEIRDRDTYESYIKTLPPTQALTENTPMAVMLLRKWAWDAVKAKDGVFFDERFDHFCSDCDLALRIAACGIRGVQLNTPYWHYGSASVRLTDPFNQARIRSVADDDRTRFVQKWGFPVFAPEYSQLPQDINFRG